VIIFAPETLEGSEIEIRPVGQPWDGTHTAVRRRDVRASTRYAGVFGSLLGGWYEARVRGVDTGPVVAITATGGTVTEVIWPNSSVGPADHSAITGGRVAVPPVRRG
jgi:hypothetical protein